MADQNDKRREPLAGMRRAAGRLARSGATKLGYDLVPTRSSPSWPPDFDERLIATCEAVDYYTLTSIERIASLVLAVRHLVANGIDGAMVECGVWRGGSMMAVARTLVEEGDTRRDLWMYDTFDRMPEPGDRDYSVFGSHASELFDGPVDPHDTDGYRYLPLDEVRSVLGGTGYPADRMRFVVGLVEETIPAEVPDRIALLRLDTDWYSSTKHEMEHLFPRLVDGGILVIDDYGHFTGARDAVDEYLATLDRPPYLHRIDFTGRLVVVHRSEG